MEGRELPYNFSLRVLARSRKPPQSAGTAEVPKGGGSTRMRAWGVLVISVSAYGFVLAMLLTISGSSEWPRSSKGSPPYKRSFLGEKSHVPDFPYDSITVDICVGEFFGDDATAKTQTVA